MRSRRLVVIISRMFSRLLIYSDLYMLAGTNECATPWCIIEGTSAETCGRRPGRCHQFRPVSEGKKCMQSSVMDSGPTHKEG